MNPAQVILMSELERYGSVCGYCQLLQKLHFLFKCLHNSLATRENLFRRSIVDSPACFRCGAPMEYSLHILRNCTLSRSAWSILRPSLLAASTHNTDVMQWLVDSILSEDDNVAEFGNMITWALWYSRNARLFQHRVLFILLNQLCSTIKKRLLWSGLPIKRRQHDNHHRKTSSKSTLTLPYLPPHVV
jgi:hypothetical protein